MFPSWGRKRCKHKVMGELVLVPGQRPRFKVAPVLQTTEHEHRNGGLSQAQLLQDVILSVYPNLTGTQHWHSKVSFEPFEMFILSLLQSKENGNDAIGMEELVTSVLSCHCGWWSFSCGLLLLMSCNFLLIFGRTASEWILCRAVHLVTRHYWNLSMYDSLVGVKILSGLSGK